MAAVGQTYVNPNPLLPQHPARISVFGESGSGKTYWLTSLLASADSPWNAVIWVGSAKSVKQSAVADLRKRLCDRMTVVEVPLKLKADSPEEDNVVETVDDAMAKNGETRGVQQLIVFDDLMKSTPRMLRYISETFTTARHLNGSVVELLQRVFSGSNKDNRLNSNYFVLFAFGDMSDAANLFKAITPRRWKEVEAAYREEIGKEHGYLLIDQKARYNPDPDLKNLRVRASDLDVVLPGLANI